MRLYLYKLIYVNLTVERMRILPFSKPKIQHPTRTFYLELPQPLYQLFVLLRNTNNQEDTFCSNPQLW